MKKHFYLILAIALIFSACKKTPETCFTHSSTPGSLDVAFSNCSIDATNYDWDFGDGGTSIAENPTYTFSTYGDHQVTLRATSKQDVSTTLTQTISLSGPNLVFTGNYTVVISCDGSSPDTTALLVSPVPGTFNQVYLDSARTGYAEIESNGTTFIVPRQTINSTDVEGEGILASGGASATMTLRLYLVGSSSLVATCNYVFTR